MGTITRTQSLEVEPFIIVGIIVAIRRMLIHRRRECQPREHTGSNVSGGARRAGNSNPLPVYADVVVRVLRANKIVA